MMVQSMDTPSPGEERDKRVHADGDRAHVRAAELEGWIERNANQHWVLASRHDASAGTSKP